ncbi:curli-like amyloid fiber formation chaperone CsgH [uncultured Roseovarius sp.]|uniref:curli-like amyloid fiber formation chaperone CsgH n=1 Tax=uncultured Roseovarius sp. TaxID=293344 RepID=UPI0025D4758C|nr:curli-like amyloid fiber formation chaperone CsgH [uncultured Roseovarius sp.]
MKISRFFFAILAAWPFSVASDEVPRAWLDMSQHDGLVQIEVFSNLKKGLGGEYQLNVVKSGPSGKSVNRQSGTVPVSQGEAMGPLSVSRVSLEPDASLSVTLKVTDKNGSVFEDEKSLMGK